MRSTSRGGQGRAASVPRGATRRPAFMRALGLLPPYSIDDVKKVYRDKARRLHPDAGGDPEAFKLLHAAYRQALDYARFQDSRRDWLGNRVESYVIRERVIGQIQQAGGRCVLGSVDNYLEEFGRDFSEVLRELNAVELSGPQITDDTLDWINALGKVAPEIRTLAVTQAKITAAGLIRFAALGSLRALDLRGTPLSVDGLEVLASLPSLEWLHLGRTGIGYWSRRRLRRDHPQIQVVTKASESPPTDSHWDEYLQVLRRLEQL